MGNEESLLELEGLAFTHPEPHQHMSEDLSSYSSLLPAAFSLLIFLFFFFKYLNNTKRKNRGEEGRKDVSFVNWREVTCQLSVRNHCSEPLKPSSCTWKPHWGDSCWRPWAVGHRAASKQDKSSIFPSLCRGHFPFVCGFSGPDTAFSGKMDFFLSIFFSPLSSQCAALGGILSWVNSGIICLIHILSLLSEGYSLQGKLQQHKLRIPYGHIWIADNSPVQGSSQLQQSLHSFSHQHETVAKLMKVRKS